MFLKHLDYEDFPVTSLAGFSVPLALRRSETSHLSQDFFPPVHASPLTLRLFYGIRESSNAVPSVLKMSFKSQPFDSAGSDS
jgi:hypothetical protein